MLTAGSGEGRGISEAWPGWLWGPAALQPFRGLEVGVLGGSGGCEHGVSGASHYSAVLLTGCGTLGKALLQPPPDLPPGAWIRTCNFLEGSPETVRGFWCLHLFFQRSQFPLGPFPSNLGSWSCRSSQQYSRPSPCRQDTCRSPGGGYGGDRRAEGVSEQGVEERVRIWEQWDDSPSFSTHSFCSGSSYSSHTSRFISECANFLYT